MMKHSGLFHYMVNIGEGKSVDFYTLENLNFLRDPSHSVKLKPIYA